MLKAEPEKEAVDRQHAGYEQQPPKAQVFPSAVPRLLGRWQRGVTRAPDDALRLFRLRWRREERRRNHHHHAEGPGYDRAMQIIRVGRKKRHPEEIKLQQQRETEAGEDRN